MLFKFTAVVSPLCYFCGEEIETLEHFFFFRERVRTFWKELNTILKSQKITSSSFDVKDVIFGLFHPENNSILVNYIILESKYFIYRSKLKKTSLSTPILLTRCKKTYQIERFIARKNNKLYLHNKKWEPFISLMEQ